MDLQAALHHFTEELKEHVEEPHEEAIWILSHALSLSRSELYLKKERLLEEDLLSRLRALIERRKRKEPYGYLTGRCRFLGVELALDRRALIPRHETELLVSEFAARLASSDLKGKALWDLCTGSGAIALALKKRFPELQVFASDLSQEALELARENGKRAGLEVLFLKGDLFEPFEGKKCDFLLCNPPYVSENEYVTLDPEVRQFEPRAALVAGAGGYEFYERIARDLPRFLRVGGLAALEIGSGQGAKVVELFEQAGFQCQLERDFAGHDRFVYLLNGP